MAKTKYIYAFGKGVAEGDGTMAAKEDRAKIDEILLKIRLLDGSIYKQYTA